MKQPGAIAHEKAIDLLIEKGYLARRYPLTEAEFNPALLAALTAAPAVPSSPAEPREPDVVPLDADVPESLVPVPSPPAPEPVTFSTTTVHGNATAAPGTPFYGISTIEEQRDIFIAAIRTLREQCRVEADGEAGGERYRLCQRMFLAQLDDALQIVEPSAPSAPAGAIDDRKAP